MSTKQMYVIKNWTRFLESLSQMYWVIFIENSMEKKITIAP